MRPPPSPVPDGTIEFSSAYSFSEARDGHGQIAKGTYDLVGIAEHEIGHLLGFVSGLDFTASARTVLDLFRYGAAGQQSASIGARAYFSLDGGRTPLADFSDGWSDQASHWKGGTQWNGARALMDPEIGSGAVQNITPLDITALDVIGWDTTETRVSAVPLPPSAPLLAGALLMLGFAGRTAGTRDRLRASGVATHRSASRTS